MAALLMSGRSDGDLEKKPASMGVKYTSLCSSEAINSG
jgi:hypothetical protein